MSEYSTPRMDVIVVKSLGGCNYCTDRDVEFVARVEPTHRARKIITHICRECAKDLALALAYVILK